ERAPACSPAGPEWLQSPSNLTRPRSRGRGPAFGSATRQPGACPEPRQRAALLLASAPPAGYPPAVPRLTPHGPLHPGTLAAGAGPAAPVPLGTTSGPH